MKFATPSEAAKLFGVSVQKIRRGIKSGEYPHMYVGKHALVDIEKLSPLLEQEKQHRDRISTTELSEATGLKSSTIHRGIEDGWLPYTRDGRHYRFHLETVLEALEKRVEQCTKGEADE